MDKHIYFLLLFVLWNFGSGTALKAESISVNGQYFHRPTGQYLFIERVENGLILKRKITDPWRHFAQVRKRLFVDDRGNRLEIRRKNEVVFVSRKSVRGFVYKKVHQDFHQNEVEVDYISKETNSIDENSKEGLWYDKHSQTYLIVVETRDGIKVRLKDERVWYPYFIIENRGTYISEEKNTYEFSEGKLIYFHNSTGNTLTFDKISDNFDGY